MVCSNKAMFQGTLSPEPRVLLISPLPVSGIYLDFIVLSEFLRLASGFQFSNNDSGLLPSQKYALDLRRVASESSYLSISRISFLLRSQKYALDLRCVASESSYLSISGISFTCANTKQNVAVIFIHIYITLAIDGFY